MQIRKGGLDDPQVIALLKTHLEQSHAESPPESVHALDVSALKAPQIRFFSAWDGETLLGMGAWKRLGDIDGSGHGEVKSMHTARAARGRGIATALLRHIMEDAKAHGIARLSLETGSMEYFRPAHALYTRHGFVECAPFAGYAPDPNSVFMTRALRDAWAARGPG